MRDGDLKENQFVSDACLAKYFCNCLVKHKTSLCKWFDLIFIYTLLGLGDDSPAMRNVKILHNAAVPDNIITKNKIMSGKQ